MAAQRSPLARLLSYARHRRSAIAIATVYSVLNKLFDLAPPMLIGAAVDVVVQQKNSVLAGFGIESVDHQILWLALATLRATSPPSLAPGYLSLLGLIGLVSSYGQSADD